MITERLLIRRLEGADLADFQAYRTNADLARYQGWKVTSDAAALEFLEAHNTIDLFLPDSWRQLGIAEHDGRLIGDIGIYLSRTAEFCKLGVTLSQTAHRRGFAGEALGAVIAWLWQVLPISYVQAITDARNTSAQRLLDRLGMTPTSEQTVADNDETITERVYRLSRPQHG